MLAVSCQMASFRGSWRNQMVTKTKPTILAQLNTCPGSISAGPYEQERKRSSAMAYKNERDRICYQQNSREPERHHGEMLGLSGIVLPPEPCGSNSNYHDPNRWHNHLSLPLMPAPIDMVHVPYRGGAPALTDLIAGQVQVMFPSNASAIEYIRAVCPLRVRTLGDVRSMSALPPESRHCRLLSTRQLGVPQADLCIAAIGVVIQRADRVCRPHEGLRHAVAQRLRSRRTCPAPPPCRSREAPLCEIK